MKIHHLTLTLLAATAVVNTVSAQRAYERQLEWNSRVNTRTSGPGQTLPGFAGAFLDADRGNLPYFFEAFDMPNGTDQVTVGLADAVFEQLPSGDIGQMGDLSWVGPAPVVSARVGYHRKEPVAQVSVYPYRRNGGNGALERLVSFKLVIEPARGQGAPKGGGRSYPDHSVLQSGDWFRFTVLEDGVHELTYSHLLNDGVLNGPVPSDQLNVYGNHHGQLPYQNSQLPPTDLLLNNIHIDDGGDGQFGQGDRLLFYASGAQRWDLHSNGKRFYHTKHVFTDSASYFLAIGGPDGPARVTDILLSNDPATDQVTAFNDRSSSSAIW